MALIYMLEDDPDSSACVEQWLTRAGHQVKAFERPHEFFYEVNKQAPRCAVIDHHPETGARDGRLLKALVASRPTNRAGEPMFGVYATVVTPGRVAVTR